MTNPCPEALEIARQIADSWRADGRLGQLESHIAPAIQELIAQRDATMFQLGEVWGRHNVAVRLLDDARVRALEEAIAICERAGDERSADNIRSLRDAEL
jgi:hypothetical protein